jgi:CBS domain-containing protein
MTTEVVTVEASTPFKTIVALLAAHGVSAVPVVDIARHVVGVVSEADLLLKEEDPQAGREAPMWERKRHRLERGKAAGAVARDLMTTPAQTVGSLATVAEAARLMHAEGVKRLPVVDTLTGRLVGIVSRGDLLRVFARPDAEIRSEIVDDVILGELFMDPRRFTVEVRDGVVALQGQVERRSLIPILVRAVHAVEGVVQVEDHRLGFEVDDSRVETTGPRRWPPI